ncbi:HAD family phosphatase [Pseudomonas sp. EL_65y_Pfl2_R95]|uniref:HAD family phosphatase n=1 Tax=Pseudomonas sp. EL_65y_Pfl2_R95 TaxID=3088698 RepID=UPI0030DBEF6C
MNAPATHPQFTAVLFGLSGCLVDFGAQAEPSRGATAPNGWNEFSELAPGALELLNQLKQHNVPCAWLDELPKQACTELSSKLPEWIKNCNRPARSWPAPDACWQALMALNVSQLDGCVLISSEPRLLQAGLNAGLWTIGLAACGQLCGKTLSDWQNLEALEREQLRAQATLALYRLGVHAVTDQLTELGPCLSDLNLRRLKGERP